MTKLRIRRRPVTELRDVKEAEGIIEAYVSVFDVEYRIGPWGDREIIEKGAFDQSIKDKPVVPFFWAHNWPAGHMIGDATLSADDHGLIATAKVDLDDELGRRVFRRNMSGALDEFSIGYIPTVFRFDPDDEELERVIEAQCLEASSCVMGANPATEPISVRNRSLMVPVLLAGNDPKNPGGLTVTYVETDREDKQQPRERTADDGQAQPVVVNINVDADAIAAAVRAASKADEPAPAKPVDLTPLLKQPKFRELVRERLSSAPLPSGS